MATWMEIRCDVNRDPDTHTDKCWSSVNAGPAEMAGDTQAKVISTLRELHTSARKQGWKQINEGWACPHCARNQ